MQGEWGRSVIPAMITIAGSHRSSTMCAMVDLHYQLRMTSLVATPAIRPMLLPRNWVQPALPAIVLRTPMPDSWVTSAIIATCQMTGAGIFSLTMI